MRPERSQVGPQKIFDGLLARLDEQASGPGSSCGALTRSPAWLQSAPPSLRPRLYLSPSEFDGELSAELLLPSRHLPTQAGEVESFASTSSERMSLLKAIVSSDTDVEVNVATAASADR
jgi:hypothetical protein